MKFQSCWKCLNEICDKDGNRCWVLRKVLPDFRFSTRPATSLPKLTQKQSCDCNWSHLTGPKNVRQHCCNGVDFHFQVEAGVQLHQAPKSFINKKLHTSKTNDLVNKWLSQWGNTIPWMHCKTSYTSHVPKSLDVAILLHWNNWDASLRVKCPVTSPFPWRYLPRTDTTVYLLHTQSGLWPH